MKKIIFSILLSLISGLTIAQVSGSVATNDNKPLISATVSLLHAKDSALIKMTISDKNGKFEFEQIPAATYIVSIRNIGFALFYSRPFTIDKQNSTVTLEQMIVQRESVNTLGTVTVAAKKPLIERRADRTIVNVDALISNTGSNALEVLEMSPGVQVDNNDAISLKGKSGVAIYIDDKPTYLSGADLANYLKSLPASALDKIEIMTTPPAKYDAAGNAGIINIKTKKNKIKGFNGNINISYRQGVYGDSRNTLNFNYRNNKINLFGNIVASGGNNYSDLTIQRWYNDAAGNLRSSFAQNSFSKRWYNSVNGKIGMDYSVGKRTTLGIVLTNITRPSTERRKNTGFFFDKNYDTDSIITADNYEKESFKSNSINFNYRYQFDSLGKELTMDADLIRYRTTADQLFKNASYLSDNTPKTKDDLIGALPSDLNIYSYKTDYTHPLNKTTKLEAGLKASYISTDNIAAYFTRINNVTTADYDKTNHFVYKENINAAYINFSKEFKKLSIQFGLRVENTVSRGHQLGNIVKPDSSFKKNYTNLFPTMFLSYKLDSTGNNQLNFAYSKRIDRPYYADLNPFISPLDKFTYYAGNPFLKPQFAQNFELSHSYKSILNTSIFYDRVKDEMGETIELSGSSFISRTGNISKKNMVGFSMDATIKPWKWWTVLPYVQYVYTHTQSKIYTEEVNTKGGFWTVNATNQFNFTKGWSAELLGRYRSRILEGQFYAGKTWQINMGAQKKIWKDKASIKINFVDIFRTRINEGDISGLKNGRSYYHNLGDFRAVIVAFTYRFAKGSKDIKQARKTGGAESEQNRVKE